jgi:hypothetical protein
VATVLTDAKSVADPSHPALQPVFTAHSKEEKLAQRKYFFWYERENKQDIIQSLQRIKRIDLINELYPGGTARNYVANKPAPKQNKPNRDFKPNKRNNNKKKY